MEHPARIGKYEIEQYLGGGMSRVYRARNPHTGQTVVVKVLTEAACADEDARSRALLEAKVLSGIVHENILRVYDFDFDGEGHPYMVMEFLQGRDLRSLIKGGETGEMNAKLKIAAQIAGALEHVHAQRIIHRDIKPENIHVNPGGVVKLMDFGIAKVADLSITQAGMTMGTPYYMPPEQVMGRNVTHLADVYSFGVLLFELFAGVKPITGDSVEQIFYKILQEPLDLSPLRQAGAPQPVMDLVAQCTEKDPARRPQSFTEVRQKLEAGITGKPETAEVEAPASGRKWLLPAAAALVLVTAVAAYFLMRPRAPALAEALDTPVGRMVLVRGGPFLAGQDKHSETLPDFYIDQTEVTNAAYQRYCMATGRPLPEGFPKDRPGYPVVNVTFLDAREFARWAGKRLPAMLEWEKAARGADGRLFPWGNERDKSRANVESGDLVAADAFANGESPAHARNMAGNAWEFVDQMQTPSPEALRLFEKLLQPPPSPSEPWYTIRGGSFKEPLMDGALYDWGSVPARYKNVNIGFRCVK